MKYLTTAFIFHKGKLLLVFHKKLQKWMHVGGHVEEDEYFDDALFREIEEETGLKVEILDKKEQISEYELAIPFFVRAGDNKENKTILLDYVCVVKGSPEITIQKEELLDYKWITEDEIEDIDTYPLLKTLAKRAFKSYNQK